jgi:benzoylformate decarboxylase
MNGKAGDTTDGPAESALVSVREAVLDLLRSLEMTTVFGNPGSTELPFLDRWPDDFRYVLGLQEASVVGMADGYARATGRAAFCNLHSAAGVGHALGNIYNAYRNQTPLVISAGQQSRSLLPMNPFLGASEAASFPKPYVKWSCEPARGEDVPAAIAHAYRVATQRPYGPTFVSIPFDDWRARTRRVPVRTVNSDVAPDPKALESLVLALNQARRPVLVAGSEIDQDHAGEAMVALAERLGAPVWAAPFASRVAFPEDHEQFAGFLTAAPEAVSQTLNGHDLVLVIGAPVFTFHVPGDCALFSSGARIFQITADGEALAAAPAGTGILGSLRHALTALVERVAERERDAPKRKRPPLPKADHPIKAEYLLHTLSRLMPREAIVVEEAPVHRPAIQAYLPIRSYGGFHTMASGGLGYSLPAAVGVSLADPGRRVVCIIGDGSMMYSLQALWTAVQHTLPLTVIVLNNAGYGALRSFGQMLQIREAPGFDLPGLDFVALAKGMGCEARRITRPEDIADALTTAWERASPFLIDVCVESAVPNLY